MTVDRRGPTSEHQCSVVKDLAAGHQAVSVKSRNELLRGNIEFEEAVLHSPLLLRYRRRVEIRDDEEAQAAGNGRRR